jgi:hypothetical protein
MLDVLGELVGIDESIAAGIDELDESAIDVKRS